MKILIYTNQLDSAKQVQALLLEFNFESNIFENEDNLREHLYALSRDRVIVYITYSDNISEAIDLQNWLREKHPLARIRILPRSKTGGLLEPYWREVVLKAIPKDLRK